ncbi:MAG: TnpV protein [Clostridia bacterium]|nr:TnpV protein [Clostridia bacterium]
MKTLYETLGGTYREENGRLIPEIKLPEQTNYQIGKYGQFYLDYIKNHRRGRYTTLLTEGKLNARLHEIDLEANRMIEIIILRLAAERGVDENLKARDMLIWIAEMNNIKASAEEIVLKEVIYKCELSLKNCSTATSAPIQIAEVTIKRLSS